MYTNNRGPVLWSLNPPVHTVHRVTRTGKTLPNDPHEISKKSILLLTQVQLTTDNRVEKWIGNVHGRSNQNVWSAASPFEAIQVNGSRKYSVMVCQHSAGCSLFFFHILMEVVFKRRTDGSYVP